MRLCRHSAWWRNRLSSVRRNLCWPAAFQAKMGPAGLMRRLRECKKTRCFDPESTGLDTVRNSVRLRGRSEMRRTVYKHRQRPSGPTHVRPLAGRFIREGRCSGRPNEGAGVTCGARRAGRAPGRGARRGAARGREPAAEPVQRAQPEDRHDR